ncbi:NAD(P)-binding domain-containing protein [Klebsiella pneumoniae]|uniref:NAD(P)-binding domain-containing protein n=1 Tax=Klebsiella pneumoniae TaxID=573 RepID=UPI00226B3787|nr:NAD(P)-binding domain-containing protein [Klebsiella pneumoniae]
MGYRRIPVPGPADFFPGADICCHYGDVTSWKDFRKGEYIVIGGYESAVDAAVNLLEKWLIGKNVNPLSPLGQLTTSAIPVCRFPLIPVSV